MIFCQWCTKLNHWEGGHIHVFMFTDHKNNHFQKKFIVQKTNICEPHSPKFAAIKFSASVVIIPAKFLDVLTDVIALSYY